MVQQDWWHLLKLDFVKSLGESSLYIKNNEDNFTMISLYDDDLLVRGSNIELIQQFKKEMMQVFEMTNLKELSYFLIMEIKHKKDEIFIY